MPLTPLSIGILETGRPGEALVAAHGSFTDMVDCLLRREAADLSFTSYPVIDGTLPNVPTVHDAWIVTGSHAGVYDPYPWIAPLKVFLRRTYEAAVPVIGICFGHQVLAEALGGKAIKWDGGIGVGMHDYSVIARPSWMADAGDQIALQAHHGDQVSVVPPGAQVLATSRFCANAMLAYGDRAFSIQPHPEFTAAFAADLIRYRRGTALPEEIADRALETVDRPDDAAGVARWMLAFIDYSRKGRNQEAPSGKSADAGAVV